MREYGSTCEVFSCLETCGSQTNRAHSGHTMMMKLINFLVELKIIIVIIVILATNGGEASDSLFVLARF